jgi:hypothetical protein
MCSGFDTKKQRKSSIKRITALGNEPIKIIVIPKSNVSAIEIGTGKYLLGLIKENRGTGKTKSSKETAEKVDPAGVKAVFFAISNGRKIPKKDKRLTIAAIAAVVSKTNISVLIRNHVFNCDTVTKYRRI